MNRPADSLAHLREIAAFLDGSGPLEGRWFGESRGPTVFWWRPILREAIAALTPQPPAAVWNAAELMAADQEYDRARHAHSVLINSDGNDDESYLDWLTSVNKAVERLDTAIARRKAALLAAIATPTPAAVPDAVRGLVDTWHDRAAELDEIGDVDGSTLVSDCARALEAALSAAPESNGSRYAIVSALEYLTAGDTDQAADMLRSALAAQQDGQP